MAKVSTSTAADWGPIPAFSVDLFPGRVKLVNISTPVATLPGVSAMTGWPGVSILRLGETESVICNFSLSVAALIIV